MTDEPTWWEKLLKLDPALVRGAIVSIFALIGTALNTQLDDTAQLVVSCVLALFALLASILIRPTVTPNAKVIVLDQTPLSEVPTIEAGEATVPAQFMGAVEKAAKEAA